MPRTYDEERKYIERLNPVSWKIEKGFVPNMNVSLLKCSGTVTVTRLMLIIQPAAELDAHNVTGLTLFQVEGVFFVNKNLENLMFEELRNASRPGAVGGFLPAVKQIANVASLPGIVGVG